MKDVLTFFGLKSRGANFKTVKKRIAELNIDDSHFMKRVESSNFSRSISREEFLRRIERGVQMSRSSVKTFIRKFEIMPYECSECSNTGEWKGKSLSLQLEHRNGIPDDHRMENLCFLCPNCHSQTDTFAGKALKKVKRCKMCGAAVPSGKFCDKCRAAYRAKDSKIPPKEVLEKLILEKPSSLIAKDFGVSDVAIAKWCKKLGITKPARGFWQKQASAKLTIESVNNAIALSGGTSKAAQLLRVSNQTLTEFCSRNNVQRPNKIYPKVQAPSKEELSNLLKLHTLRDIAAKFNCSHYTTWRWKNMYGIKS